MNDFLKSGLVYIPAWIIGRFICREWPDYIDPYIVGWIVASFAVLFRFQGPSWIRPERSR